jgi:hypothetical protein
MIQAGPGLGEGCIPSHIQNKAPGRRRRAKLLPFPVKGFNMTRGGCFCRKNFIDISLGP